MTEQELIEQLADKEHASWARRMEYLINKCGIRQNDQFIIPIDRIRRWQRQIDTPYERLSEEEKQADRDEVAHILPIIKEYTNKPETLIDQAALVQTIARMDAQIRRLNTEIFATDIAKGKDDNTEKRRRTLLGRVNDLSNMAGLGHVDYSWFLED